MLKNGLDQPRILGWVVFQIGILEDDDLATRLGDAAAQCRTLAPVSRVIDNLVHESGHLAAKNFRGTVRRSIVDHDDLLAGDGCRAHALDKMTQSRPLVEAGDDDRQQVALRIDRRSLIHGHIGEVAYSAAVCRAAGARNSANSSA